MATQSQKALELQFYDDPASLPEMLTDDRLAAAGNRVLLEPWNAAAAAFAASVAPAKPWVSFLPPRGEPSRRETDSVSPLCILFEQDPEALSKILLSYVDLESGCLIAPVTSRRASRQQHYVVTIPKSGTHLLLKLLDLLAIPYSPDADGGGTVTGTWKVLHGGDTHTPFEPFFANLPWHGPDRRRHPFFASPTVFLYRHPLDILGSEVNYLTSYEATPFAHCFAHLPEADRLELLISGPLGSLDGRVMAYVGWLHCPNVIPLSFEELVGPLGGGPADSQWRAVWSLQLKLHAPGDARSLAAALYDERSPTFFRGQIGRHRSLLNPAQWHRLKLIDGYSNFMARFGYDFEGTILPRHAETFRRRPLRLGLA